VRQSEAAAPHVHKPRGSPATSSDGGCRLCGPSNKVPRWTTLDSPVAQLRFAFAARRLCLLVAKQTPGTCIVRSLHDNTSATCACTCIYKATNLSPRRHSLSSPLSPFTYRRRAPVLAPQSALDNAQSVSPTCNGQRHFTAINSPACSPPACQARGRGERRSHLSVAVLDRACAVLCCWHLATRLSALVDAASSLNTTTRGLHTHCLAVLPRHRPHRHTLTSPTPTLSARFGIYPATLPGGRPLPTVAT
jgi:hypothetical protein